MATLVQAAGTIGSRVRTFLDALRGCEGRRVSAANLRDFYQQDYTRQNPDLDRLDATRKAAALVEACRFAGLSRTRRLLEVGCGSGAVLAKMHAALQAEWSLGVDYGYPQARIAATASGVVTLVADGAHLPFGAKPFDFAYVTDVLEHVIDPVGLLVELGRVAQHVGFLVPLESGLIANPLYAYRRVRGKPTNLEYYGHIWRWFRPEVHALLRKSDLTVLAALSRDPGPTEGTLSQAGRALAATRSVVRRWSPGVSELLFGGVVLVGVACTATLLRERGNDAPDAS